MPSQLYIGTRNDLWVDTGTYKQIWANWSTSSTATTVVYGTSNVWSTWSTPVITVHPDTWRNWQLETTTAYNTNTNDWVWQDWTGDTGGTLVQTAPRIVPVPLTPEQIAAREAEAERQRRYYAEMEARRQAASAVARDLLTELLTEEQEQELITHARFHVRSQHGRLYRINQGSSGNVELIEDGKVVGRYCIHPSGVPAEDTMAAQKLMLETDENRFHAVANVHAGRRLAPVA